MIIVTGSGRSNTSTVARLLHDKLGVDMGRGFDAPSEPSPRGSYEDARHRQLHIDHNQGLLKPADMQMAVDGLVSQRAREAKSWGFKDPRASYCLPYYLRYEPLVIWCWRTDRQVVDSLNRHYHTPRDKAAKETEQRLAALERSLSGYRRYWVLDFRDPWPEEHIEAWLEGAVQGAARA